MSRKSESNWVRTFEVTNPTRHRKGFTVYRVTSKVMLVTFSAINGKNLGVTGYNCKYSFCRYSQEHTPMESLSSPFGSGTAISKNFTRSYAQFIKTCTLVENSLNFQRQRPLGLEDLKGVWWRKDRNLL